MSKLNQRIVNVINRNIEDESGNRPLTLLINYIPHYHEIKN